MTIISNLALMDTLRQTKMLSAEQIESVWKKAPNRLADARTLARIMLQEGWLTVYQINQLLAGNSDDLVFGPYHVLDRLGQGGQSTVYKARHSQTGQVVALKVVRSAALASPEAARQFMLEVEAMAKLDHPNVVHLLDADKVGSTYYVALEYVEGTDLGKYVRLSGPLPAVEACDYIRQAALGLQHAHERNLVHRDIKPVNLYLTGDASHNHWAARRGQQVGSLIKILDWGLAGLRPPELTEKAEAGSGTKVLLGTADYLSPEQAINPDAVDIRADIYSLGCTLYFLLAGHPPFPTGNVMRKILAHQNEEPAPIDALRSDLPPGLAAIVRRMMAKKPDERFQTPAAVALALKPHCHPQRFAPPQLNREVRQRLGLEPASSVNVPAASPERTFPIGCAAATDALSTDEARIAEQDTAACHRDTVIG